MNGIFPFSVLDELQRDMNHRQAWLSKAGQPEWRPAVDVVESESAWLLSMDVPGVAKEAIEITVEERILTVKTERSIDYGEQRQAVRERRAGQVSRQFRLPETVDAQNIEARVENGVLSLALPKQLKS
ncbi:Hsp20/alpha crystallin family protein [Spongiibacter sp. KMU-158]|uniref:Hsp20/alpha crystallin family protein n=1 Tax=Spongiibacter pelagi TaxID=2760804 RepID=A0A927C0R5_9GAMM|nr:Hsp20/alpha crystallin family protein [Spongiibacter pelagi]MBD2857676.1 Hsp20/alpha crystallin family protein [Spongiibacter pelagi]